jgi:cell division protein FtsL
MKPLKVLFFLCIVFVLLMFVSMVFPERGIKLYNKHRIQFPLLSEFIKQETVIYPDISQIINENADFPSKILKKAVFIDTTQINSDISKPLPEILSQQNSQNIQLLEIPSHNSSIFAQLFSDLNPLALNHD